MNEFTNDGTPAIVVNGVEMVTRFRREDNGMDHVQPSLAARS